MAVVPILPLHGEDNTDYKNSLRYFRRRSRLLCAGGFFCYVRDNIMIKLICDKCGKDYTDEFSIPNISLTMPIVPTLVMNSGKNSCTTYLCDDCAKQVYDFIFGEKPDE